MAARGKYGGASALSISYMFSGTKLKGQGTATICDDSAGAGHQNDLLRTTGIGGDTAT